MIYDVTLFNYSNKKHIIIMMFNIGENGHYVIGGGASTPIPPGIYIG